jgi:glycosyltransferase involved in cell wall biosynthesis
MLRLDFDGSSRQLPRAILADGSLVKNEGEVMRITWVTRALPHYRVCVLRELDSIVGGTVTVIYNKDLVRPRDQTDLAMVLGHRAMGTSGEVFIGSEGEFANEGWMVPWRPGMFRLIRDTRPDVLIGDGFFKWTAMTLAYRALRGTPLVVCYEKTLHTERRAQWWRRVYRRACLNWIDAFCCSGSLCSEYLESLGVSASRITTGHMTVDVEALAEEAMRSRDTLRAQTRATLGVKGVVVLYVGRLVRLKNLQSLLEAWKSVDETKGTLVLIGDGAERDQLKEAALAAKLKNVIFAGHRDPEEMPRYYAAADVFAIPTLEDNWSLVVPEAMSCGLPIICSMYNGCWPELVIEGRNGWVIDPLQAGEMSRRLAWCLGNPAALPRMGAESLSIVRGYSPKQAAGGIARACAIAVERRSIHA